jgi:quercetin dioxygenase-like cupin family protein
MERSTTALIKLTQPKYKGSSYLKAMIGARALDHQGHAAGLVKRKPTDGAEMKVLAATLISLSLSAWAVSHARTAAAQPDATSTASAQDSRSINITRSGSQQAVNGPAEHFTGSVYVQPLFPVHDPSRTSGGQVTFEPGARSAWHTHPLGQTLIVTEGTGWIQQWGGPIEEIRKGDVIWIPPGVKHWHGATPNTAMTHIAIQEQLNGKAVEWMEKVTDDQYGK